MNLNQDGEYKNLINRISYLINKRLSSYNLNKVDNIYENTLTLIREFEKQNQKLNNKISVLETLVTVMNKDIVELKKKYKNNVNIEKKNKKIDNDNIIITNNFIDENNNNFINENNNNFINENNNNNFSNENNNNFINENINNIDNNIYDDNLIIEDKKKNNINKNLNKIPELKKINSFSNYIFKEIKKEPIELEFKFIQLNLHQHNINSDIKIFKKIYIDEIPKSYYPIRYIKNNYQYWLNDKMNLDDENGSYIKETVITNIINIYLNINSYENYIDNNDLFLKNQEYIINMSKQKYKDKFFKNILKIIDM